MYRLYLFDFDYTLVNSEQGILGCFHRTIDAWHLPSVTDDTIRKTIGLPMEQAVEIITGIHDAADIDRFIDDYRKDADIHMTPGTHFFPDTLPTLRALRKADAKIGIISTKTRSRIEEKFVADGCTDVIDLVIGCEDVHAMKPSPEGIEQAIARLGMEKDDVLYTGDSLVDAGAAKNAGVAFAAVTTGTTPASAFEEVPHVKIMKSLRELIAPAEGTTR